MQPRTKNTIRATITIILAAITFSAAGVHAQSAAPTYPTSFDCSKAKSDSEHLICENGDLAAKDVRLAGLIKRARTVAVDQAAFKEWARSELKDRQKCHDAKCVSDWYDNQFAEYEAELSSNKPASKQIESNDTHAQPDSAQDMPPACAQLVHAMEACTADLADWGDYNDPAGAAKLRESTRANVAQLKAGIQQAVKEKGAIAVAQHCASHDVKAKIVGDMGGMITPVLMNRGDASNCQTALAQMQ